jgi:hypothetical protein
MLINVTSTEQTVYMVISDGGTSVIMVDRGVNTPKRVGGRRHGLQENVSFIRVSETLFHAF